MTGALRSKSPGEAIALAGVAVLTVAAILGIAAVVLGSQCSFPATGSARCYAKADPVVTASVDPDATTGNTLADGEIVSTAVMKAAPAASAKPGGEVAAPPPADDIIDATFELLAEVEADQTRTGASAEPVDELAIPAAEGADPAATPLSATVNPLVFAQPKRAVPLVSVSVPASRRLPVEAAYAAQSPSEQAAPTGNSSAAAALTVEASYLARPEADAPEPAGVAARPADLADAATTSSATNADKRIVGGSGVNVRSGPSRSSSRLFALTGGQEVTVTGNDKGWLSVIDAKGRRGWIYKDYLSSPD